MGSAAASPAADAAAAAFRPSSAQPSACRMPPSAPSRLLVPRALRLAQRSVRRLGAASDRSTGAGDAAAAASGAASSGGGVGGGPRAIHLHRRRRRRRAGARVAVGRRLREGLAACATPWPPSRVSRPLGRCTARTCSARLGDALLAPPPRRQRRRPLGDLPGDLPPPGAAAAQSHLDREELERRRRRPAAMKRPPPRSRAYRSLSCSAAATNSAFSSAPMPFRRSASSFITSAAFASGFAAATSGRVLSPRR